MIPFRCSNCTRLLGKIEGKAEIKCPKCNTMNTTGTDLPETIKVADARYNKPIVFKV